jgi:topoisomerase-4 subunit A
MAEVIYYKKGTENEILNFEEFIAIKGIKAIGNQLSKDKIRDINLLDPLPYEEPEVEEVEVVEEEVIDSSEKDPQPTDSNDESKPPASSKKKKGKGGKNDENQITLF